MSRRLSRPSSAASHGSRPSTGDHGEFRLDCKAAYLSVMDDIRDDLTSREDLLAVLQQAGRNPSKRTLDKYWTDEDLSFDDFVSICRREPMTTADDLMKAFRKIDLNGDGYISLDELYRMLTTRGDKMSRDEVRQMIDEVDENKDGKLDYGEFCNMLVSTTEQCKKMSMKLMQKKEQRKKRMSKSGESATPRRADGRSPSHSSLRSVGRTGSKSSLISVDDMPRPSPRVRKDKVRPPVGSSKSSRITEPSNLREWAHTGSKGCFFVDTDEGGQIISHQYTLDLPDDSNVWITIQPIKIGDAGLTEDGPVDTALYVLHNGRMVTFTEQRDSRGKYCVRCDLSAGKYKLIPFTTGCRLKERQGREPKETKLIKKDRDDKIVLTKAFKKSLEEIFDMADLDGNGLLSREEFNWFNIRTSGENVADDEWNVVEGNIELKEGEITKAGFVRLNEMEAEDNEGDCDDLWMTLSSMGFNKGLVIDQACPFKIEVYTEDCDDADLRVTQLENPSQDLEEAVIESAMAKGEASKVKGMKDLTVHTYIGDARASIVLENKSYSQLKMQLDCSKSKNCISNHGNLDHIITVQSGSSVIGHHLLPSDERSEWIVRCHETILK